MSHFSTVAQEVSMTLHKHMAAAVDMDAEKQRVNSYIADVLKDSHVLYAKLARLQGDFKGTEADDLFGISQKVLDIGDDLSRFAQAFREGEARMAETSFSYGDEGGAPQPKQPEGHDEPETEPEEGGGVPFGKSPEEDQPEESSQEQQG